MMLMPSPHTPVTPLARLRSAAHDHTFWFTAILAALAAAGILYFFAAVAAA
jgi:hypothetical protein